MSNLIGRIYERSLSIKAFLSKNFYSITIITTTAFHIAAAWFSIGFYQPDEQYQIVEFAGYKVGLVEEGNLMWEYAQRIRPWAQPFLVSILFRFLVFMGVNDAYVHVFILRLITAIFSLGAFMFLAKYISRWIPNEMIYKSTIFFFFLGFYVPMLHARPSSENVSSSLFIIALAYILWAETALTHRISRLLLGMILGLAIIFRYQLVFMVIGLLVWLLSVKRMRLPQVLEVVVAIIGMFIIGVCIDYWGYQEWTLSAWNYFKVMFITQDHPANETYVWWYYVVLFWQEFAGLFGVMLFVLPALLWFVDPHHILSFITIPFVLMHLSIPHKETRYLFPYIYFAPIMIGIVLQTIVMKIRSPKSRRIVSRIFIIPGIILLTSNSILLAVNSIIPRTDSLSIIGYIRNNIPKGTTIYWESDVNPFTYATIPLSLFYGTEFAPVEVSSFTQVLETIRTQYTRTAYYWYAPKVWEKNVQIDTYCTLLIKDPVTSHIPIQFRQIVIVGYPQKLHRENHLYQCHFREGI